MTLNGKNINTFCKQMRFEKIIEFQKGGLGLFQTIKGSYPTLVRVFLCPRVGPFPFLGLTLRWENLGIYLALQLILCNYLDHCFKQNFFMITYKYVLPGHYIIYIYIYYVIYIIYIM